ncbi:hypothetical protein SKAU_G00110500 [Synaphobranchus kaupii]|uniref:Inactive polyglycylase TTLL10 n=1 Tax=Synaphobranchus kaupii TaxID=118154 RepID=A0A9Q1G0L3_SYNKA|nr:hypothetical protein SKAU_G00110500 [Synaphobranchus kaupii]
MSFCTATTCTQWCLLSGASGWLAAPENDRATSGKDAECIFSCGDLAKDTVMSSEGWVEPSNLTESGVHVTEEPGLGAIQSNSEKDLGETENTGGSDFAPSSTMDVRSDLKAQQQEAKGRTVLDENVSPQKWRSAPGQKGAQATLSTRGGQVYRSQDERLLRECRRSPSRPQRGEGPLPACGRDRSTKAEDCRGSGPFFFIGGGNGATVVASYCESQGWQRITDKTRDDYKLKWCEIKSKITYYNFREGEQLLFQIPNNKVLTTKIGLLCSLREYERVSSKVNQGRGLRRLKMEEFFPDTFRMDVRDEKDAFFAQQKEMEACGDRSQAWISKPTGLNQGRGIFLLRTEEEIRAFQAQLQSTDENQNYRRPPFRLPQARIVQRYIQNPLLLKGKKFDVRSYFLIACTTPYMVFFRHGYVRLTCDLYDPNSNNLSAHLTNQYMQKKNPLYSQLKEGNGLVHGALQCLCQRAVQGGEETPTGLGPRYFLPYSILPFAEQKRMQAIMTQCFLAVKAKLERKLGLFDLIGCDFMIDEDFKVWFLEMNCNPSLQTNCQVLKEVVPSTVTETLDLTLEIFNKCRGGLKLLPLDSQRDFVLLYGGHCAPERQSRTAVPRRTAHLKSTAPPRTQKAANEAANRNTQPAPAPPTHPPTAARNRRPLAVKIPKARGTWLPQPKPVHLGMGAWEHPSDAPWHHRPAVRIRGRIDIASLSTPALGSESRRVSVHHQFEKATSLQKEQCVSTSLKYTQLPTCHLNPSSVGVPPGNTQ